MHNLSNRLVAQRRRATPEELAWLTQQAAQADFCRDLLEVDEALWGGFWQFDVISPGSRLPAIELNLLRAVRLDRTWPTDTTVEQYLADLREAILQPEAGLWTLPVVGEPCAVFAVSGRLVMTVVWYCGTTGQLHAGYRGAHVVGDKLAGAVEQRPLPTALARDFPPECPAWLEQVITDKGEIEPLTLATQLDVGILQMRRKMA